MNQHMHSERSSETSSAVWPWAQQVDAVLYKDHLSWPKISVITPSYNQGHFIEETILSVLNQQYPNLEYIIIDGGSEDATVSVIRKYASHITYWVSEPDSGQTHALNKGIAKATGDIVFWINSDDYFEPNTFYTIALEFMKDPALQVVCANTKIFGNGMQFYNQTLLTDDVIERVITMNKFEQPATIFKLSCIQSLGGFDEAYHFIMDREFWVHYLIRYGLEHVRAIPDVIANFRLHEVSKTVAQKQMFDRERDELFIGLLKDEDPFLHKQLTLLLEVKERSVTRLVNRIKENRRVDIRTIVSYYLLLRAMEFYETGDKRVARELIAFIHTERLQQKDQKLLQNLKVKIRFMPHFLKKMIQETGIRNMIFNGK